MCKTLGPNLLPRRKLKEILDIPLDSKEEVPGTGNVNARNTMFELSLASRLHRVPGVVIKGFDDVDVLFNNTAINVQCKRLAVLKDFKSVISDAYCQAQKRVNAEGRFIIALSVEKTLPLFRNDLILDDLADIDKMSNNYGDWFINEYQGAFEEMVDIRLVAFLINFKFRFINKQQNKFTPAQQLVCFPFVDMQIQSSERSLIEELAKGLNN